MATRVLLVEDNDVYRSSLELLLGLQPGLEVVGAVGTGDAAADAARGSRPTWSSWTTACPGSTAPPRRAR